MDNVKIIADIKHTIEYEKEVFNNKINVMYGLGKKGKRFFELFIDNGIKIDYIIDNDPDKEGRDYKGVEIISIECFKKNKTQYEKVNVMITTAENLHEEILKTLEKVDNINILILKDFIKNKFFNEYIFSGGLSEFLYDDMERVPHRSKFIPELCFEKDVLTIGCVAMIEIMPLMKLLIWDIICFTIPHKKQSIA